MMNRTQAAYNLLLMMAVVDGNIDERERRVIQFYVANHFPGEIDFSQEEEALVHLEAHELLNRFASSANSFFQSSKPEDRVSFMLMALDVVMADGKMTADESEIFRTLASAWGLDFEALLDHYAESDKRLSKFWTGAN